jgi:hypothetical protein
MLCYVMLGDNDELSFISCFTCGFARGRAKNDLVCLSSYLGDRK